MTTGLDGLLKISDARKTAIIDDELLRHSHSTIDHGVLFAVSNTFLKMLEPEDKGSERLLPLCPHTFVGLETLIGTYAPTLTSIPGAKDLPERYHQEHPQQQSPYPPWRLQCQSRSRP